MEIGRGEHVSFTKWMLAGIFLIPLLVFYFVVWDKNVLIDFSTFIYKHMSFKGTFSSLMGFKKMPTVVE